MSNASTVPSLFLLLFWGLLLPSLVSAQTAEQDSLLLLIAAVDADTAEARLLIDLADTYRRSDWKTQYQYSRRAFEILEGSGHQDLLLSALYLLGTSYLRREEHSDSSLVFFEEGLSLARETGNSEKEATFLLSFGSYYHQTGVYNKAFEYYEQGVAIAEREGLKKLHCRLLNNIGLILMREEEYDGALSYFDQAYMVADELGNQLYMSAILSNTGVIHGIREEYDLALANYTQSLELKRNNNDQMGQTITICNIGNLYRHKEQYELAATYQKEGLVLAQAIDFARGKAVCLEGLAYTHRDWEKYGEAIQFCKRGLTISESSNLLENQVDLKQVLSESYAGVGDFSKAYEVQAAYLALKDSMFSLQKLKQINELETQYQVRQKEAENQLIKEKQIYQEDILRRRKILNVVVIILLLVTSLLAMMYYRSSRQKQQYNEKLQVAVDKRTAELNQSVKELKETNQELEHFAFIASHDLKEPLRSIISFNDVIQRRMEGQLTTEVKGYFDFVNTSGRQMYELIESTLEFSRLSKSDQQYQPTDVQQVVEQAKEGLHRLIEEKKACVTYQNLPVISSIPDQLYVVFRNLIENGIKYNDQAEPQVSISYQEGVNHEFTITDNGIGISAEYHEKVFEMFKRLHDRKDAGSGLGLSIVSKVVERLGGSISLDSEVGTGSTFIVRLPK